VQDYEGNFVKVSRRAALVVVAAAAALVPVPAPLVERWYSNGLYLLWQRGATAISNQAPFAIFDALLAVVVVWWAFALVTDWRRSQNTGWTRAARVAMAGAVRTASFGAAAYLAFVAAWGLNYRRVPLEQRIQFDAGEVTSNRARELASVAVDQMNGLHDRAHGSGFTGWHAVASHLPEAFLRVQLALGVKRPARPARPKKTLLDTYFKLASVSGMTDPYALEMLMAGDLLPVEQPFVVAHEWSHLAGFADESEASFVGWLTCLWGPEDAQYSAWLSMYSELAASMTPGDRRSVAARLASGPREDLRAIRARLQQNVNPAVAAAGWQVYDHYLKANRVEAGAASYAQVVRLGLGARFDPEWTPRLRP